MTTEELVRATPDDDLRRRAITRIKKRNDFHVHVLMYVLVNGFFTGMWLVTSNGGFFWPAFLLMGWGIGLVANGWDVYRGEEPTEERIQQEMDRLQGHR